MILLSASKTFFKQHQTMIIGNANDHIGKKTNKKVLRMSTQFNKLLEIDKRMQKGVKTEKFYSKFLKIGDVKERNSTKKVIKQQL